MSALPGARSNTRSVGVRAPQGPARPVQRKRIVVCGIVQGVGFRPFVNRLAREYALAGAVSNFAGGVSIDIEGRPRALEAFILSLREHAPPIAVIDSITLQDCEPLGRSRFVIEPSDRSTAGPVLVSPDVAICADCRRELHDPADRRYRHPFINCTNCGPRFTIISRVPYDRPFTSMSVFDMCPDCAAEYGDIDDRRYHAQPVACPVCGPTVELRVPGDSAEGDTAGAPPVSGRGEEAIRQAQHLLSGGGIVAVKGLGGFHLACDAGNEEAVSRLRRRKGRDEKPLAVMAESPAEACRIAHVRREAIGLLASPQAPIVLAPKAVPEPLAPSVAPDSADYGIMLPYTPLHILLLDQAPYSCLVMTSANLSDEPLCTDNREAIERLAGLADAYLLHNRDIVTGCDDSVVRVSSKGPIMLRRSRGYAPFPVKLGRATRPTLAVGAQLKSTFCITSGQNAFLSQHMGDLDDASTLGFFERSVEHLCDLLQVKPEAVACDLHPDYLSTRYARELAGRLEAPLLSVQHHHAHIAACMADNQEFEPVIGLACDGTGLGDDGSIWGCEVLVCELSESRRAGHLRPALLPGGEAAIRQPWRSALGCLAAYDLADHIDRLRAGVAHRVTSDEFELVRAMVDRSVNCPPASSAGRLFDAVSALLGLHTHASYEGQAAIGLEAAAVPGDGSYPYDIRDGERWVMDPAPMLAGLLDDVDAGASTGEAAGRFHKTFAHMLVDCADRVAAAEGISKVALSGGTFQNRILLGCVIDGLREHGLTPLYHRSVPPNDGGIALGQAVVAHTVLGVKES